MAKTKKIAKTEKQNKQAEGKKTEQENSGTKLFIYAIVALAVIIIIIVAVRYMYKPKQEFDTYSYNNFLFVNISGMWITEIQKEGTNKLYRIPLHFGPLELEDIPISDDVNLYKNYSEIYITFNPLEEQLAYIALSASELSINLAQTLNITPIAACTRNDTEACFEREVIDCETEGMPAIFLRHANTTQVYVKNNCIFVEGMGKDLVRAADKLLLKWFSVMK